jgi:hypothetical protein
VSGGGVSGNTPERRAWFSPGGRKRNLTQPRDEATRESGRFFELITEVREQLHAGGA